MKKNNSFLSQFLFLLPVLFYSCAQIVSLGGGNQDSDAPKAIKYMPDSASVQFTSKKIAITFNEYIQLNDIQNQLIVSPPFSIQPDIKAKEKTLLIELKEALKPNTTYTFNFGNAIRDITENNTADNFQYVFSTGTYIDSISYHGIVKNAFDNKVEKGNLVMLYDNFSDSAIYKQQPLYFSKTREDGSFSINNIREGKYQLAALKDNNTNYLYDSPEELVGFNDSLIYISKNDSGFVSIFKEEPSRLFVKKAYMIGYQHLLIVFSKKADSIKINLLQQNAPFDWKIEEYSTNKDSLHIWLKELPLNDSIKIQISDHLKIIDTAVFKLLSKEQFSKKSREGLGLKLKSTVSNNGIIQLNDKIIIETNHPIDKKNEDKIFLIQDSAAIKKTIPFSKLEQVQLRRYSLLFSTDTLKAKIWKEDISYTLKILPGAFTDIYGYTNDTLSVSFKTNEEKFYGSVKFKIELPNNIENALILLVDEKDVVIRETKINVRDQEINYSYLTPRKYKLKVIHDKNRNGVWDTGNYLKKVQPETVFYYPGEINVRSDWDLDLTWKIK